MSKTRDGGNLHALSNTEMVPAAPEQPLQLNKSLIAAKKRNKREYITNKRVVPWLFLLPGILATLLLKYVTIGTSVTWSFFNVTVQDMPGEFVGLQNYINLFTAPDFGITFGNTLVYLGLTLLLCFLVPIIQAVILNEIRSKKLKNWFSTLYILPAVIPGTVIIVIWRWIWNPEYGVANYIFGLFGLENQAWLSDPELVKLCIVIPGILGGGLSVLLYYAAILGVPKDIYEAAELDGCSGWKKVRYIILPNIKFIILVQLIMTVIGTFQIMDVIFQFTNGGPAGASNSLGLNIYKLFNEQFQYGQGSALSTVLLLIIAIITLIQLKVSKTDAD
ncbi:carbohydrate ABC transporter permease [Metabacillus indicus]|uniref:carbohydrate ABC transporter permease n=1 Tax=Metabacillus indicus TaxID=246786 RepID=UPI000AA9A806|nr:sugar ABC transporter permease [Metabacillus indicus]